MLVRQYFAKWFEAVSVYLPDLALNFSERIWFDPLPFAVSNVYDRSFDKNIAISYPAWPFKPEPTLIVVSGNKQNMLAVASYGDGERLDAASRKPLDFIKDMAGTDNIINLIGDASIEQRRKMKPFLTDKPAIDQVFSDAKLLFEMLFDTWDASISLRDNISYGCTSLIASSVLGIPSLTREQASVITKAGNLLRESEPGKADFTAGKAGLEILNHELLTLHNEALVSSANYIRAKAEVLATDNDLDKNEKLLATRGASNLLVESNLTMLVMTAIVYVSQSEQIKARLLAEIGNRLDLSLEELRKLPYLNCIYKEALRFASPTPMIIRETSKPLNLSITNDDGGQTIYRVPNHALLFAPIRRMHHDPRYWEKPEEFKPERFEDSRAEKFFMPFSLGARSCPAASHFNEVVFKAALLVSVQYDLSFDKEIEHIPAHSLTSRWKQEYYIHHVQRGGENMSSCKVI